MAATVLFVHVPVDRVEIVSGPKWKLDNYHPWRFKLRTAASAKTFYRTIKLEWLQFSDENEAQFTAIFCGAVISGAYNMKTRKGWFSLD
jgi:hypothetical protein